MKQDDARRLSWTLLRQRQRSFARSEKSWRRMSARSDARADDHAGRTDRHFAEILQSHVFQQFTSTRRDPSEIIFRYASYVSAVDLDNQSRSPGARASDILLLKDAGEASLSPNAEYSPTAALTHSKKIVREAKKFKKIPRKELREIRNRDSKPIF
jgi:hypothetical protein